MSAHPSTKRLYCFRHGLTDWNAEGRIQGHLDVPLNDVGRTQARALTPVLAHLRVEAFLSSDLSRASETARISSDPLGCALHHDPRLREIHLGKLQGLTREEMDQQHGTGFAERTRSVPFTDEEVAKLGCETGQQVRDRALEALADFCQRHPHLERIGVSTHGGVMRRLVQHALGIQELPAPIPNSAIYPLIFEVSPRTLRLELQLPIPARRRH